MALCRADSAEAVDLLCAADANGVDENVTPLHCARRPEVMKALIARGADPNQSPPDAHTPLMMAFRDINLLTTLLENGADPNRPGKDGMLPLDCALADAPECVETLLAHGADPNALTGDGTPAFFAAQTPSMLERLVRAGANLSLRDAKGRTFADLARARFPANCPTGKESRP